VRVSSCLTAHQHKEDKGHHNLVSGFRKTGIYPLDKQQVLARLPSQTVAEGGDCLQSCH